MMNKTQWPFLKVTMPQVIIRTIQMIAKPPPIPHHICPPLRCRSFAEACNGIARASSSDPDDIAYGSPMPYFQG
jgi:hypothetical protein